MRKRLTQIEEKKLKETKCYKPLQLPLFLQDATATGTSPEQQYFSFLSYSVAGPNPRSGAFLTP